MIKEQNIAAKLICAGILVSVLSGCGWFDKEVAKLTGVSRMCVGGVEYLQFTSGASVSYSADGKVKTCK